MVSFQDMRRGSQNHEMFLELQGGAGARNPVRHSGDLHRDDEGWRGHPPNERHERRNERHGRLHSRIHHRRLHESGYGVPRFHISFYLRD